MSRHESDIRLRHMLDYAREAVSLAQGKSRADLDTDRLLNLALVQLVTMVGEAAKRVPRGVICLVSALAFHELTTQIPHFVYLAIGERKWTTR